jgi:alkyl hydroperoxide reductase subunit AhpC
MFTFMPLTLNTLAPDFEVTGALNGQTRTFRLADFKGSWLVLFFYPADFTFVCPTEILGFEHRLKDFSAIDARVAAVSVDGVQSHLDWSHELGGISYPLLSDPSRTMSRAYDVLNVDDQRAYRATVILSPQGRIAYLTVSPMNVGRSVEETLRVVKALQTGRLCPADWRPGEATGEPNLRY